MRASPTHRSLETTGEKSFNKTLVEILGGKPVVENPSVYEQRDGHTHFIKTFWVIRGFIKTNTHSLLDYKLASFLS